MKDWKLKYWNTNTHHILNNSSNWNAIAHSKGCSWINNDPVCITLVQWQYIIWKGINPI